MKKLMIFSVSYCSHCNSLKKRLDNEKIVYNDFDVDLNRHYWDQIVEYIGIDILPTVYIEEENGGKGVFFIPGQDFKTEDEIVQLIKTQFDNN